MESLTFFIAGTMQGRLRGGAIVDQGYRERMEAAIRRAFPDATVICPYKAMLTAFGAKREALLQELEHLATLPVATADAYERGLREVVAFFADMTRRAAAADVLVAYLAADEPSMGTAMEMWSAHAAGRTVITITAMRDSLAVLATSHVIVPDLDAFAHLLNPPDAFRRTVHQNL
jgi:hypothetical protein